MSTFTIKRGDTLPKISAVLSDKDGPVDLTGASVRLIVPPIVDASATIVDADAGSVEYQWQAGDTETRGVYKAEFQVTFPSGDILTFPNDGFITVQIDSDLG